MPPSTSSLSSKGQGMTATLAAKKCTPCRGGKLDRQSACLERGTGQLTDIAGTQLTDEGPKEIAA